MLNKKRIGTMVCALLFAYGTTAVLLLLLSVGLWKFNLSEEIIHGGLILLYIVSVFAGGFFAGKKTQQKKFLWGMAVGLLYVVLWAGACMIANGPFQMINQNTITIAVICILSGTLGGMVA